MGVHAVPANLAAGASWWNTSLSICRHCLPWGSFRVWTLSTCEPGNTFHQPLLLFLCVSLKGSVILGKVCVIDLSASVFPICGTCYKDLGSPLILPHLRERERTVRVGSDSSVMLELFALKLKMKSLTSCKWNKIHLCQLHFYFEWFGWISAWGKSLGYPITLCA